MSQPEGTFRVIGIASGDALRSVTLVLMESDGDNRIRRLETRVVPLEHTPGTTTGTTATSAVAEIVLQFIGNLVLQPFAVDALGLSQCIAWRCDAATLAVLTDVDVRAPYDLADPTDVTYAAEIAAYLAACNLRADTNGQ
jgi:hypothetical protein